MNYHSSNPDIFRFPLIIPYVVYVLLGIAILLHIIFAVAVARDSSLLNRESPYRGTTLVDGATWTLATLLGGVLVVLIYWLLNRSTLRPSSGSSG